MEWGRERFTSSVNISFCRFEDNFAQEQCGSIYIKGNYEVSCQNCVFVNNSVKQDGGGATSLTRRIVSIFGTAYLILTGVLVMVGPSMLISTAS